MRLAWLAVAAVAMRGPAAATTLEKLSLDEMVAKSTEIVRGRVASQSTMKSGAMIYTIARVDVLERWKGAAASRVEVAIPGGSINGLRQSFSGAPHVGTGYEYVFFLWRGRSGMVQILGLSQGLLDVKTDSSGKASVNRDASSERMLDAKTGTPVRDEAMAMPLGDLRRYVLSRAKAAAE